MPHISENFYAYTDGNDLAILLNEDTFVSGAAVFPISEASNSKDKWSIAALVVRGLLRRPSVVDSPTVTFCSAHLHNNVAKKRDASISLLQRLREHMIHHSVDFIGGDFNMSTFSAVGDVFSDPDETCRECSSFSGTHTPGGSTPWLRQVRHCRHGLWTARPDSALPVNTTPHLHSPAHVNFSRVAQGRAKAQDKHCVSSTSQSSHLARHVSRAVTVVSLFDVTCTFHSFSSSNSTVFERRTSRYSAT